jgi:hypothetical protein
MFKLLRCRLLILSSDMLPSHALIPTVTDNLFSQHVISADLIGIYFEPTDTPEKMNGEVTWGEF